MWGKERFRGFVLRVAVACWHQVKALLGSGWLTAAGLSGQSQDGDGAVSVGASASSGSEGRDLVVAERVGAGGLGYCRS